MSKEQTTAPSHARRTRKKRIVGAAVALAIATGGGIAVVSTASAADLGYVSFKAHREADSARYTWGTAWELCRQKYRRTRSLRYLGADRSRSAMESWVHWMCRDTP